jgi:hypothetical protein
MLWNQVLPVLGGQRLWSISLGTISIQEGRAA